MKMKNVNKILTSVLSVSMLLGSTLPALAAEGGVDVDAPIYSYDVIDVIVPTTYAVAFNPDELQVNVGDSTSGAQILSKNYGIINKSNKDKVVTVSLTVADQNTDSGITFVDTADEVANAEDGEYKIHLKAIPANADDEVKIGTASATHETQPGALNDVVMTPATAGDPADDPAVTLKGGENYIGFKLDKAEYTAKNGGVTLGETKSNDVSDSYEVSALATGGAGITAFTFAGEMNKKADWFKLTKGIKITVVYGYETAPSDMTTVDGTGAMVELNIEPTFTTGSGIGQIKYSRGAGNDGLKEIKKVQMTNNGKVYDGYNANGTLWPKATDESGVVTLSSQFMSYFKSGDTVEATVTYLTNGGDTKTVKVDVIREIINGAPTFTTGDGIGVINYTMGAGDDGLKEIKKIEATNNGKVYDGYNANGTLWPAATDASGVITLSSKFMSYFTSATVAATVTYETNSGETRTASLDVKCK